MPVNFVVANREKTLSGNADEDAPLPRLVPDQIRKALAASLARLQSTYVDLLQLHWPDRYTPLWGHNQYDKACEGGHQQQPRSSSERVPFDDVVRCLGELLAAGKIKVGSHMRVTCCKDWRSDIVSAAAGVGPEQRDNIRRLRVDGGVPPLRRRSSRLHPE